MQVNDNPYIYNDGKSKSVVVQAGQCKSEEISASQRNSIPGSIPVNNSPCSSKYIHAF